MKNSVYRESLFETERLILRRWREDDVESLFEYAKDPAVGPIAGWPPHKTLDDSRFVIENVFCGKECYAICLKETRKAVGAIELLLKERTDKTERDDECELGFWLGKPLWGNGYMPEAVRAILRHAFCNLKMRGVWCAYYDGNVQSKRVQEKCGFVYHSTSQNVNVPLMNEYRTAHSNILTKDDWEMKQREW